MTKEGFERAKKIEQTIEKLKETLKDIEKIETGFKHGIERLAVGNRLQGDFQIDCNGDFEEEFKRFLLMYKNSLKNEIEELEKEFEEVK